jgi:hypothetical protein
MRGSEYRIGPCLTNVPDRVETLRRVGYQVPESGHISGRRMTDRQRREGARRPAETGHPPSHRFEEGRDAHDVHHAVHHADEIVGQRRQAEFGSEAAAVT